MFLLTYAVQRLGELFRKLWNPRNFKAHVSPHEMLQAVASTSKKRFKITEQGWCPGWCLCLCFIIIDWFNVRWPNWISLMVVELTTYGSWWHQKEEFKYIDWNCHCYCILKRFVAHSFAAVVYDTFRGEMKIYTRKLPPPLQVSVYY